MFIAVHLGTVFGEMKIHFLNVGVYIYQAALDFIYQEILVCFFFYPLAARRNFLIPILYCSTWYYVLSCVISKTYPQFEKLWDKRRNFPFCPIYHINSLQHFVATDNNLHLIKAASYIILYHCKK